MSYDLYLNPRSGVIQPQEYANYFSSRPNYKDDLYENEDTGVYFLVNVDKDGEAETIEDKTYPVTFNINLFRPSYFILEVEPEITAFVHSFDMTVFDPQSGDEGEYNSEFLKRNWHQSNEWGYSATFRNPEQKMSAFSLPTDELIKAWSWNLNRQKLQKELGDGKFVPKVMFFLLGSEVATAAVWPDGIPIAVPDVDYFIVPRKELAPRRLFMRVEDEALVAFKDAFPILDGHRDRQSQNTFILGYDTPPSDVITYIKSLSTNKQEIKGLAADEVLNRELVKKY